MLRKLCKVEPTQKSRLMNAIFMLSNSKSSSVLFECANTIIQLTTAPSAIKIAIQSYLALLQDQNDNNVKLIVLNKITVLKKKYGKILEEYISDILNIIREDSVQSVEINQKVLELVTDLASNRNVKEVGLFLENEIYKAKKMTDTANKKSADGESKAADKSQISTSSTNEYRFLLIKCINQISQMFPETIPQMIFPLMDSFLQFEKKGSMASLETIIFIREVVEIYPQHRQ
jgi:coatomer subunit beta